MLKFYDSSGKGMFPHEFLSEVEEGWRAYVLHIQLGNFTFPNAVLTDTAAAFRNAGLTEAIEAYEEHMRDSGIDFVPMGCAEDGEDDWTAELAAVETWQEFIARHPDLRNLI